MFRGGLRAMRMWIPIVLYGAGPRSILETNAHNADENLRLNDLRAVADLCAEG
jgi:succinyl-diaminopimelate desuccinylase